MNFYLKLPTGTCANCAHCKCNDRKLHIGKSSTGWVFALHVIPARNINSLNDWIREWNKLGTRIVDESDEILTPERMLDIITNRHRPEPYIALDADFYKQNCAEPGPRGLCRSVIDGYYCIGHGSGTWDLYAGEFC